MDNNELRNSPQNSEKTVKEKTKKQDENILLTYLHDFVFLITGVLLTFSLLFRVVVVSGPSMNATLVDGDWLVLLGNVLYTDPQPGDIIVASKDSFKDGEPIIKRVIATEGQKVDIDFSKGIVYVDNLPLVEPYTLNPTTRFEGVEFPLVVEKGCVFVLGDNRDNSKDSRSPDIGQIDCREILGKAVFLLMPGNNGGLEERKLDRIGVVS